MHLIDQFACIAKSYLTSIDDNPIYPKAEAIHALEKFDTDLQDESINPGDVLAMLDENGTAATVKSTGGRYYGFVIGGLLRRAMGGGLFGSLGATEQVL